MSCFFVPPITLRTSGTGVNVTSNVAGSSAPVYSTSSTYAKDAIVLDSVTSLEYQSVQAGNQNKPLTDKQWWLSRGYENRMRMFDRSVGSQTTRAEQIIVEIDAKKVITTVMLLNVVAQNVTIELIDPVEGSVPIPNNVVSMVAPSGGGWWKWHFVPVSRETRVLFDNLPAYSQAKIRITINNPGLEAKCGVCIVGRKIVLGESGYGASVGINDYSVKTRDAWGGYNVQEGDFTDLVRLPVQVEGTMVDAISRTLAKYRAVPCLYVGTEFLKSTWAYGYFTRFENIFTDYGISDCNVEIESLT